jgi:hypothetical protein
VQHTNSLGAIELVKITGDEESTILDAVSSDKSVIINAEFHNPIPDFMGTFGMPNLGKLKTILNIPEYRENAKLSINTQQNPAGQTVPSGVHFENAAGDFKNDYRFMSAEIVTDKLKVVKFKGVKWGVDVVPTNASIQRMRYMASANSEETTFMVKTDGGKLKFFFGDHSSHGGDFVFADGVSGILSKTWSWPIVAVISIFGLPGDKNMKISSEGVLQITVDSGICTYTYMLPAFQK